jgi:hypothetical protein
MAQQEDGEQSPLKSASLATGAALKETLRRLVNTVRELLQTVRFLLQSVVSLLRMILVSLREGLMLVVRPVGKGIGALAGSMVGGSNS